MSFGPDATRGLRLVFVRGLTVQARLGVHAHEKARPQRVTINIELSVRDPHALAALHDPRVEAARVTVEKPEVYDDVEAVGVVVERRRS